MYMYMCMIMYTNKSLYIYINILDCLQEVAVLIFGPALLSVVEHKVSHSSVSTQVHHCFSLSLASILSIYH